MRRTWLIAIALMTIALLCGVAGLFVARNPSPASAAPHYSAPTSVKPAQAGKKAIPPGLYVYGNPYYSGSMDTWYATDAGFHSDPDAKGFVLEVAWDDLDLGRDTNGNVIANWNAIDRWIEGKLRPWNAAHPTQYKYWILRMHVYWDVGCTHSSLGYSVPAFAGSPYVYYTSDTQFANAKCRPSGYMIFPPYDSTIMQTRFREFVMALGARYDDDPDLAMVQVATGLYGERQPAKNEPGDGWALAQNWLAGQQADKDGVRLERLTAREWVDWVNFAMLAYHDAFPMTQQVIMDAPAYGRFATMGTDRTFTDRYINAMYALSLDPPTGLQNNSADEWDGSTMGLFHWRQSNIPKYNTWYPTSYAPEYPGTTQFVYDATDFDLHPAPTPPLQATNYQGIPVAFERGSWGTYKPVSLVANAQDSWWCYLHALSLHADIIFPTNYKGTVYYNGEYQAFPAGVFQYAKQDSGVPYASDVTWMNQFANRYAGVNVGNTPGVWWVAFNSPSYGYIKDAIHWDREFFLYRMDIAKNSCGHTGTAADTVCNGANIGGIPDDDLVTEFGTQCKNPTTGAWENCVGGNRFTGPNGPPFWEGDYTRRTNEASGDTRAYFNIDDGYHKAANATDDFWEFKIKLYDRGTDTVTINYDDAAGAAQVATITKTGTNKWKWFNVALADFYANNGASQYGGDFFIDSEDDGDDEYVHMIEIVYHQGTDPTPTPFPASTSTFTAVPGASNTPTDTPEPTETPTANPVHTLTSTATRTPTPAGTATPTPTVYGGAATVTYQQGVSGYSGGSDTKLYQYAASTNYATSTNGEMWNDNRYTSVLRWDVSAISTASTVRRALLSVYVHYAGSADSLAVDARNVLKPVAYTAVTWNAYDGIFTWEVPGAKGATDRAAASATAYVSAVGWVSWDVTDLVQEWIDDADTNYGVVLETQAGHYTTAQYVYRSNEYAADTSKRPKLYIEYTTAATATPTSTAGVPTVAITPVGDTLIRSDAPNSTNNTGTLLRVYNDSSYKTLMQFDLTPVAIPPGSRVVVADLKLYNITASNATALPVTVRRMAVSYVDAQVTWNNRNATPQAWTAAGAGDNADRSGTRYITTTLSTTGQWYSWDLTSRSLMQTWVNGTYPNYGLMLVAGSNPGAVNYSFASTDHGTAEWRPQLILGWETPTATPTVATSTPTPTPTDTATDTPAPTDTPTATPTATNTSAPTATNTPEADVHINEVMPNPTRVAWDGVSYGTDAQWIELYNATDAAVDMSSWRVVISTTETITMSIPWDTVLDPGEYLIYWPRLMGHATLPVTGTLKLYSQECCDPDGYYYLIEQDSVTWADAGLDQSWGRDGDGQTTPEPKYFTTPTFGRNNHTPTPTPTQTNTPLPTNTPTITSTPTITATPTDTATATATVVARADVPGLVLQLKADDIVGLSDGDAVATWADSSAEGHDAAVTVANSQPKWYDNVKNGLAGVLFDGTDDYMDIAGVVLDPAADDYTVFAVVESDGTNWGVVLQQNDGDGTGRVQLALYSPTYGGYFYSNIGGASCLGQTSYVADTWAVPVMNWDATDVTLELNGSGESTCARTATANDGAWRIGAAKGTEPQYNWDGYILEVLVYTPALDAATRNMIARELGSDYDIIVQQE